MQRRRFIHSRVAIRHILALYTGRPAGELEISRDERGKPAVMAATAPFFSLSHSGELTLLALGAVPLGVDTEQLRMPRSRRVIPRIFSAATARVLTSSTTTPRIFTDAWTQREAHVKAEGGGLFRTPDALPFTPVLQDHQVRRVHDTAGNAWSLAHWQPAPGMRAAVAAAGTVDRVRHITWDAHHCRPGDDQ